MPIHNRPTFLAILSACWLGSPSSSGLCASISPPVPPMPPPEETPTEDESSNAGLSGQQVYIKECAVCHGAKGEGTERGYPLRYPVAFYADAVTRAGRSGNPQFAIPMPGYTEERISTQQLQEMWAFLSSDPRPSTGKELYDAFCGNCHGFDGRGGFTGKNIIKEIDEFSEYIRKGKSKSSPLNRRKYMPAYRPNELSREEVRLMRRYAEELRKRPTNPGAGDHHQHDDDDDDHHKNDDDDDD